MNTGVRVITMLMLIAALAIPAFAQFTITQTDVLAGIQNSLIQEWGDSTSATLNLGDGSNGQSWDFSSLNRAATSVKTDSVNYLVPAGHAGAASFPTASVCVAQKGRQTVHGDTVLVTEIAYYYEGAADGGYLLGGAVHIYFSPARPPQYAAYYPADSTVFSIVRPKGLGIPLPMSNTGATRTASDTTTEPSLGASSHPKTTVSNRTYTLSGEGTVKFPGGASKQVIRYIEDQIQFTYSDVGALTKREHKRKVHFYAKDMTTIDFNVNTAYTQGSTKPSNWSMSSKIGAALSVRQESNRIPESFRLNQNYPNPFNPSTTISFDIRKEGFVSLKVFNMLGQEVATLAEGKYAPGTYSAHFDAANLPSGIYMYRLSADGVSQTKSMMLVK